jgi:hypothetical protein
MILHQQEGKNKISMIFTKKQRLKGKLYNAPYSLGCLKFSL